MTLISPEDDSEMDGCKLNKLRDEVAKIAFTNTLENLNELNFEKNCSLKTITTHVATVSWEFADAFMRERYERSCVKFNNINAAITKVTTE